mgnify:CR=1 FL=1
MAKKLYQYALENAVTTKDLARLRNQWVTEAGGTYSQKGGSSAAKAEEHDPFGMDSDNDLEDVFGPSRLD